MRAHAESWRSTQTRSAAGAFESVQQIKFPAPVVERSTFGLIRTRTDAGSLEVRLLGMKPALLRFGQPTHDVGATSVSCLYPIRGGLLARTPAGSISFTQTGSGAVEVRSAITGFFPRLASRRQWRRWQGLLYPQIQARLHVALGRRYFARLWRDAVR